MSEHLENPEITSFLTDLVSDRKSDDTPDFCGHATDPDELDLQIWDFVTGGLENDEECAEQFSSCACCRSRVMNVLDCLEETSEGWSLKRVLERCPELARMFEEDTSHASLCAEVVASLTQTMVSIISATGCKDSGLLPALAVRGEQDGPSGAFFTTQLPDTELRVELRPANEHCDLILSFSPVDSVARRVALLSDDSKILELVDPVGETVTFQGVGQGNYKLEISQATRQESRIDLIINAGRIEGSVADGEHKGTVTDEA